MTQTARIRSWLETNDGLCAMAPIDWSPPIIRVAARINDLREMGYLIKTTHTCPQHRPGGSVHHAYYQLEGFGLWPNQ